MEDRCISCGTSIPEGRQVCPSCEKGKGFILTVDGVTGYFPKAFIVEAIKTHMKRGEWIKHSPDPEAMKMFHEMGLGKGMSINSVYWCCSACGNWGTPHHKYCSSCGAKMKGDNKLGDNIKRLMKYNGYTQKQLAMRSQCTESAISRYISNEREPSIKILKNLAIALGVTVDELLKGGGEG